MPTDSGPARSARETRVVKQRLTLASLGPRSLRSRGPRRRAFLVSQVTPDLAVFICAPLTYIDDWAGGSPWRDLDVVNALLFGPRSLRLRDPRR
ncbi:hypothetical protein TYRP_016987 [Tyrophagus putrescentiae]|nr:hypothetical protein TYRP_016987 [Tyrophagus putrescentiae]